MTSESEWLAKVKIFVRNFYLVEKSDITISNLYMHPTVIVILTVLGPSVVQHEMDFKVMIKNIRNVVPREYTVNYEIHFSI